MQYFKRKLTIIIIFIFLIIGLSITRIYAWLTDDKVTEHIGKTSELTINYNIWFEQDGVDGYNPNIDVDASIYYKGETQKNLKVIEMSAGNKNAINYISKLRIQIDVNTNASYYIRAKFKNEWFMKRTSLSTNLTRYTTINQSGALLMPYGINSNWYYDLKSNYTYYKDIINSPATIDIINYNSRSDYTDFSNTTSITNYLVYLDFEIEFVQANRMYAIWGFDNIPNGS